MGKQTGKLIFAWTLRVISVPLFLTAALGALGALLVPRFGQLESAPRMAAAVGYIVYFLVATGLGVLCLWFAKRLLRPTDE